MRRIPARRSLPTHTIPAARGPTSHHPLASYARSQVTHCYGPQQGELVTEARRFGLLRQYFFLCACPSCTGDRLSDHRMVGFACDRNGCDGAVSPPPGAPSTDAEVPGELLMAAAQVEKMRVSEDAAWRSCGCCDECATPLGDPQVAVERASRAHELLQVRTTSFFFGAVCMRDVKESTSSFFLRGAVCAINFEERVRAPAVCFGGVRTNPPRDNRSALPCRGRVEERDVAGFEGQRPCKCGPQTADRASVAAGGNLLTACKGAPQRRGTVGCLRHTRGAPESAARSAPCQAP